MAAYVTVGGELLKDWTRVMGDIKEEKDLKRYAMGSILLIFVFGAIFGAVLGIYSGNTGGSYLQIAVNAFKIPVLFLVSAAISLPVYYVMDALAGGKKGFAQIATLLFAATALTTIILVGFVPILLLFIMTTGHYPTVVMLTVVICGVGGFYGMMAFLSGYRHIHDNSNWQSSMSIGAITYMFAGTQFSWVLRPYLNFTSDVFRAPRGNFYVDMFSFMGQNPAIAMLFVAFLVIAILAGVMYLVNREATSAAAAQQRPGVVPGVTGNVGSYTPNPAPPLQVQRNDNIPPPPAVIVAQGR